MDKVWYHGYKVMIVLFAVGHAAFYNHPSYNIYIAMTLSVAYLFVCVASYCVIMMVRMWAKQAADERAYAKKAIEFATKDIQETYRKIANYHPLCKKLFFDFSVFDHSMAYIDIYLIIDTVDTDNGTHHYHRANYATLQFLITKKRYPTPENFKHAINEAIEAAFYNSKKNLVLKESKLREQTNNRSLAAFFNEYCNLILATTIPDDAVLLE